MTKINLNMTLSIFAVGAVLFLIAPAMTFQYYNEEMVVIAAMVIQFLGVIASLLMFYRDKVTAKLLKDI